MRDNQIKLEVPNYNSIILAFRCVAHTLQLAVNDALYKKNHRHAFKTLDVVRKVSRKLRTPKNARKLKKLKLKKPILSNETR